MSWLSSPQLIMIPLEFSPGPSSIMVSYLQKMRNARQSIFPLSSSRRTEGLQLVTITIKHHSHIERTARENQHMVIDASLGLINARCRQVFFWGNRNPHSCHSAHSSWWIVTAFVCVRKNGFHIHISYSHSWSLSVGQKKATYTTTSTVLFWCSDMA